MMNVHPADALKFCIFLGHLPGHRGCFFLVVLRHGADAPVCLGSFTQTAWLLFSGFCTSRRCSRNSTSSWYIYLDKGVVLFLGFPHTTSPRGSSLSQDIYMDMGLISFGFSAHYIMQMLRFCSGHLPRQGLFFFGFSAHYIIQMLQLFLGPLHGHGG